MSDKPNINQCSRVAGMRLGAPTSRRPSKHCFQTGVLSAAMDVECDFSAALASDSFAHDLHARLVGPPPIALPSAVESLFALYGGRIGGLHGGLILEAVGNVVSLENTRRILSEMEPHDPCLPMPCSLTEAIQRAAYTHLKWDKGGLADVLCAISALVVNPDWFCQSTARLWRLDVDRFGQVGDSSNAPVKVNRGMALILVKSVLQSLGEVTNDRKSLECWMQSLVDELLKQDWKEWGIGAILSVLRDFQCLGWSGEGFKEKLGACIISFSEKHYRDGIWTALTGMLEMCGPTEGADQKEDGNREQKSIFWMSAILTFIDGIRSNGELRFRKKLLQEVTGILKARFVSAPGLVEAILQGIETQACERQGNKATEIWLLVVVDDLMKGSIWQERIGELLKTELHHLRGKGDELKTVLLEIDSLTDAAINDIVLKCCKWMGTPGELNSEMSKQILTPLLEHSTKRAAVIKNILECISPGCSEETTSTVFFLVNVAFDVLDTLPDQDHTSAASQISEILCLLDGSLLSIQNCIPTDAHPDLIRMMSRISCWDARYPAALLKTIVSEGSESRQLGSLPKGAQESIVGLVEGLLGLVGCLVRPPVEDIEWVNACLRDSSRAFSYTTKVKLYGVIGAGLSSGWGDVGMLDGSDELEADDKPCWVVSIMQELLLDHLNFFIQDGLRMELLFTDDTGCDLAVPLNALMHSAIEVAFAQPCEAGFTSDLMELVINAMQWLNSREWCNTLIALQRHRKVVAACSLIQLIETWVDGLIHNKGAFEVIPKHAVSTDALLEWEPIASSLIEAVISHRRLWQVLSMAYQSWQRECMDCARLSAPECVQWGDVTRSFLKGVEGCGTEQAISMVRACVFGDWGTDASWTALSWQAAAELLEVHTSSLKQGASVSLPLLTYMERMVYFVCTRDDVGVDEVELILSRAICLRQLVEPSDIGTVVVNIQQATKMGTILHIAAVWLSHVLLSDTQPKTPPETVLGQLFPYPATKAFVTEGFASLHPALSSLVTKEVLEQLCNCHFSAILLDVTMKLFKIVTFEGGKAAIPQHAVRGVARFAEKFSNYARIEVGVRPEVLALSGVAMSLAAACDIGTKWAAHSKFIPIIPVAMDLMDDLDATGFACTVGLKFVCGEIDTCPWAWIGSFRFGKDMDLEKGFVFSCPAKHRLGIVRILLEKLAQGYYLSKAFDLAQPPDPAELQIEASIVGFCCCVSIIAEALSNQIDHVESEQIHPDAHGFMDAIRTNHDFFVDTMKVAKLRWKQLQSVPNGSAECDMGTLAAHCALVRHIAVLGSSIGKRTSTILQNSKMEVDPCKGQPLDLELTAADHRWAANLIDKVSMHAALLETIGSVAVKKHIDAADELGGIGCECERGDVKPEGAELVPNEMEGRTPMTGKVVGKKRAKIVPVTPKQASKVRVISWKQSPESIWKAPALRSATIRNQTPDVTPTRNPDSSDKSTKGGLDDDSPISLDERFDSPERGAPDVEFVSHSSTEREKERKERRRSSRVKRATKEKHPYIAAVLQNDRAAGYHDDDDYSDLEDFIVPSKDKDYGKVLKKMYKIPPKK